MGDVIEFTSLLRHQNIFYKISSSALTFDVKGNSCAAVGLAKTPSDNSIIWVVIHNNQIFVEKDGNTCQIVRKGSDLLSTTAFRRFWICWHNDRLSFGQDGAVKPLIYLKLATKDLQYITFTVQKKQDYNTNKLDWKLFVPPKFERPLLKKIDNGNMHWVKANNQLPDAAYIGGYQEECLYIIRAAHRGSLTPGKFVPSEGIGYISWGGEEHGKNEFEVLCGYNCIWVKTCKNNIPVGAVDGGYSEDQHETLYVGRAKHYGHLIPGKVQPSHSVCYIPYEDDEVAMKEYEILVNPQINMESINRYYKSNPDFHNLFDSVPIFEDSEDEPHNMSDQEEEAIHDSDFGLGD